MPHTDDVPIDRPPQWSDRIILSAIDWAKVNQAVEREQRNRERYAPVVSVYRWWARRPHSLIGAILDAAREVGKTDSVRVADPFSGGGTTAIEAARRHLPVYAQDLYPWPATGLATGLTAVPSREFERAADQLLASLDSLRKAFRRSDGRELTHVLRVRVGACSECDQPVYQLPHPLISVASRSIAETEAYYGCRACGSVHADSKAKPPNCCPVCDRLYEATKERGISACPHCRGTAVSKSWPCAPEWHPLLVQEAVTERGRLRARLRPAEPGDPVHSPTASLRFPKLQEPILPGLETRRLLNAGFRTWGDLYTARQANVLLTALQHIQALDASDACKNRLALAVIGAAEMPAFLSRWDRYHLKAFEGIANHRYAHTTVVVEMNPLANLGRGTVARRLRAARIASDWVAQEVGTTVRPKRITKITRRVDLRKGVYVATGNSARQGLKGGTVDLVLTDPPYYDDVQYGELARIFHFWLALHQELPPFDEREEAVPNTSRQRGPKAYEDAITECLVESKRTLHPAGRLVLTFHNRKIAAWRALCSALWRSGFAVCALAVARAENDADHSKRGGKGLIHDLVFECAFREEPWLGPPPVFAGASTEEETLLAMGLALVEALRRGTPEILAELFKSELKKAGISNPCIR
jgi:putative DNA methylase